MEGKMSYRIKEIAIISMILALMGLTSCALLIGAGVVAGAGVGTAQYIRGELQQAYAAPMEKTWNATLAAVDALKMKASEKSIDSLDQNRVIKGQTEEKNDFQISFEALSKDVTMVKVRIGMFGDEAYSSKIHESIAKNLKK